MLDLCVSDYVLFNARGEGESLLTLIILSAEYLSLHNNNLGGAIPENLNWRSMFFLDLSYNNFEGPLPADWADGNNKMIAVRLLYLDHNNFNGEIPNSWPTMGNDRLEILHVNDNELTGQVPGNYRLDNFMQSMELQNNDFSSIDNDICDLIVFGGGEMTNFRADCDVCSCRHFFCDNDRCY